MSEYFFIKEVEASPYYVFPDKHSEVLPHPRFKFPIKPLTLFAKIKPEESYEILDIIKTPAISISNRVFHNSNLLYIYGVQWVEIEINDKGRHIFYMLQVANKINCVDLKLSTYRKVSKSGIIFGLEKLKLDYDYLNTIPLKKRLIFSVAGAGVTLFHESIVDRIKAFDPKGIEFLPSDVYEKGIV